MSKPTNVSRKTSSGDFSEPGPERGIEEVKKSGTRVAIRLAIFGVVVIVIVGTVIEISLVAMILG